MKRLRAWMVRLSGLFFKQRREQEMADEMESHLQLHIEDNLRAGMTPEEARREAMLKLGGLEQTKQIYRERGTVPALEALGHDVRFALRQLRKRPGFAFTAVLVLALGIGASTAIFSAVNPILFQPLPYPDPSRVMMLWEEQNDGSREAVCFGTFHGLQERNRSFESRGCDEAVAADDDRSRRAGAIRRPAGQRRLFPCAWRRAGAGPRLRCR